MSCVVYDCLCLLRKVFSKGWKAVLVSLVVHSEQQSFRADRPLEPPLDQHVLTILMQHEPCLFLCCGIRRLKPVIIYTLPPLERKTAIVIGCRITLKRGRLEEKGLQARQPDINTRIEDL